MKTDEQTQESTKELVSDELDLKRFSRWQDDKGRLFLIYGFRYGRDEGRPLRGDFEKTDVELLEVHQERIEVVPIHRFFQFVIKRLLMPYQAAPAAGAPVPTF